MGESVARLRQMVTDRVLSGPGHSSPAERRAAFENRGVDPRLAPLVAKVAHRAWAVTDRDVAAVKEAGVADDEVFEIVVAAAIGQATRQLDAALAAVEAAAGTGAPVVPDRGQGGAR